MLERVERCIEPTIFTSIIITCGYEHQIRDQNMLFALKARPFIPIITIINFFGILITFLSSVLIAIHLLHSLTNSSKQ